MTVPKTLCGLHSIKNAGLCAIKYLKRFFATETNESNSNKKLIKNLKSANPEPLIKMRIAALNINKYGL